MAVVVAFNPRWSWILFIIRSFTHTMADCYIFPILLIVINFRVLSVSLHYSFVETGVVFVKWIVGGVKYAVGHLLNEGHSPVFGPTKSFDPVLLAFIRRGPDPLLHPLPLPDPTPDGALPRGVPQLAPA